MDSRDTGAPRDANDSGLSQDTIAGAAGGTGGAVAGAALGSIVGPIGTIIGGLAGAVGGWWAGKNMADPHVYNQDDDAFYQTHHQSKYAANDAANDAADRVGARGYDDVRQAYQLGHLAGVNPDYQNRSFDDVEPHLSTAYSTTGQHDWQEVRHYARDAWSRGREVGSERGGAMGSPEGPAIDRSSFDGSSVNESNTRLGDYGRDLREGTKNLVDRSADALDDFTDRIDGNPDSRPGRDATARPGR
jgi:hypothetical protein